MKKILLIATTFLLCFVGINMNLLQVHAQEEESKDNFYLLTESDIIGQAEIQPRGVYLMSGTSIIRDAGTGKIAAGGVTTAAKKCDVTVNVIVERLSGGSWVRVTSWTGSLDNTWSVTSSKVLSVGSGYYYRVRCLHFAHTDASSSWTSGLWR